MDDGSNEIIVKIIVPPNSETSFVAKDGDSFEATLKGITRDLSEKKEDIPPVKTDIANFNKTYVSPDGEKTRLLQDGGRHKITKRQKKYYKKQLKKKSRKNKK